VAARRQTGGKLQAVARTGARDRPDTKATLWMLFFSRWFGSRPDVAQTEKAADVAPAKPPMVELRGPRCARRAPAFPEGHVCRRRA
jgi:hypothetical protein